MTTSELRMKPVKITAELTITPERFREWCEEDNLLPSKNLYQCYVEKMVYGTFGHWKDIGGYVDFINKTIDDNGNGLKLTIGELE